MRVVLVLDVVVVVLVSLDVVLVVVAARFLLLTHLTPQLQRLAVLRFALLPHAMI